jgi:hypothetical protein
MCFTPKDIAHDLFHLDSATMQRFWRLFMPAYYGTDDPGKLASIEDSLRPYAALRLLYISRHIEGPEPPVETLRMMRTFLFS